MYLLPIIYYAVVIAYLYIVVNPKYIFKANKNIN